jgi:hypothetical protein
VTHLPICFLGTARVTVLSDLYVIRQSERHVCVPQIVRMWWRVACRPPSVRGGGTAAANSSAQQSQFFTHEEWLHLPPSGKTGLHPKLMFPYCSCTSSLPSKYLTSFHSLLYVSSVDSLISCSTWQTLRAICLAVKQVAAVVGDPAVLYVNWRTHLGVHGAHAQGELIDNRVISSNCIFL